VFELIAVVWATIKTTIIIIARFSAAAFKSNQNQNGNSAKLQQTYILNILASA
jgi:hypothetical protein